jgi:hypothetical protein
MVGGAGDPLNPSDVTLTLMTFDPVCIIHFTRSGLSFPLLGSVNNPVWQLSGQENPVIGNTYDQPTAALGDATVVFQHSESYFLATSGAWTKNNVTCYDYTDGAGNGVLYGNQFLYWLLTSATSGVTNQMNVKILYRSKKISQTELVGLVLQSNQN